MNELPLPFLLCTSQFLVATIVLGFYSRVITRSYKKIQPSARILVYQIALSYTFGFIFTNTAFSLGKHYRIRITLNLFYCTLLYSDILIFRLLVFSCSICSAHTDAAIEISSPLLPKTSVLFLFLPS